MDTLTAAKTMAEFPASFVNLLVDGLGKNRVHSITLSECPVNTVDDLVFYCGFDDERAYGFFGIMNLHEPDDSRAFWGDKNGMENVVPELIRKAALAEVGGRDPLYVRYSPSKLDDELPLELEGVDGIDFSIEER